MFLLLTDGECDRLQQGDELGVGSDVELTLMAEELGAIESCGVGDLSLGFVIGFLCSLGDELVQSLVELW